VCVCVCVCVCESGQAFYVSPKRFDSSEEATSFGNRGMILDTFQFKKHFRVPPGFIGCLGRVRSGEKKKRVLGWVSGKGGRVSTASMPAARHTPSPSIRTGSSPYVPG
jgi:hypothetical protein